MPEFLSPGVFIQEVDAGPKPIEGVSTSTAGAVGVTAFGPTDGKPVLVTSFAEFTRIFGPPVPEPTGALFNQWAGKNAKEGGRWWQFALSIKGFFDNGGQRIFVKRVISKGAQAAAADFGQGLVSDVDANAGAQDIALKLNHLIGIQKNSQVKVFVTGDPPVPIDTQSFTVEEYNAVTRTIRLNRPLGKAVTAGRSFVEIKTRQLPSDPSHQTLRLQAKALGDWGNNLQTRIQPMVGATASLLTDPVTAGNAFQTSVQSSTVTWVIEVDDTSGLTNGHEVTIKGTRYPIYNFRSGTRTFEIDGHPPNDVVTKDESLGGQNALTGERLLTTVAEDPTAPDTVKLTSVDKLSAGDLIKIGTTSFEVVRVDTNMTVQLKPSIPSSVKGGDQVKKLSAKILSAGTRTKNTLEALNGIGQGDEVFFVKTGKRFKVVDLPANTTTITLAPAIPFGFDWEGWTVEKGTQVATVNGSVSPGKTLRVDDVTKLAPNNAIRIGSKRRVIESVEVGPKTIHVDKPFVAGDLPEDNALIYKVEPEILVTDTAADWKLTVVDASGLNAKDHILLGGEEIEIVEKNVNVLSLTVHQDAGDPWPAGSSVRRLRVATNGATPTRVSVTGASQFYAGAIVELDNGSHKETALVSSVKGNVVELSVPLILTYREGNKVRLIEAQVEARNVVDGKVIQTERFTNLRLIDDGSSSFLVTAIGSSSSLIEVALLGNGFPYKSSQLDQFPIAVNGEFATLENGTDAPDSLTIDDFIGVDGGSGNRTGIQALEDIDEVSICLVPNVWAPTVHDALILHCETLKDRFAILDPQDGLGIQDILAIKENLDSKYAALYYPWIEVRSSFISQNVQVAPSGHMAGIYARVDVERGVHKAPANEIISGITKIAADVNKREQDLLNPKGINALRFFPGRSNRVWGARTISSDSSWKYINVRRLFIFVEESIDEGTQFVVFEPNAEPTWARVRQTITNFLTTVWRSGALEGTTADQAFFVKCDRTTMSQDDIDNGRLICVIGIAPVKPAEFVIFQIMQKTQESNPT